MRERCTFRRDSWPTARRRVLAAADVLLLTSLGIGLMGAIPLAEWYVDVNASNCAAGTGSASTPFCNIMDAVDAASAGDTIHIAPGTYVENLVLDKDLTLIGTGGELVTIVDGAQSGSVATVGSGATTNLTGLTLTNGEAARGGGLFLDGSPTPASVVLTSSTVTANTARGETARGGGIFSSNGALTLTDSTVSGNTADNHVSDAAGGGIYSYLGIVSLTSSTVSGNTASGYHGGWGGGIGLYVATLTLSSSTVSGNQATTHPGYSADYYSFGGGIYAGIGLYGLYSPYAEVTLNLADSIVDGNDAAEAGGGIYIGNRVTATLTNSTVTGNTSLSSFWGRGGGIFNNYSALTLQGSTVSGNSATAGGGVFSGPFGVFDAPYTRSAVLRSSTVSGNSATWGGGIYNYVGPLTVEDSEVSSNNASYGGGIHTRWGSAWIRRSEVTGNSASWGGGLDVSYSELTLANSKVTGNTAQGGEGGAIFSSPRSYGLPTVITLTNTTVSGNTASDPGSVGGISLYEGVASVTNSILWDNTSAELSVLRGASSTVSRSIVQGGWTGAGGNNLDADPLFVDPASGLFQLSAGSPAIDAGRNGALSGTKTDLDGNPRFVDDPATPDTGVSWRAAHVPSGTRGFGPIIDLGAYEFQP